MGLFSRKPVEVEKLNPDYYLDIQRTLQSNGGDETFEGLAMYFANLLFNYFGPILERKNRRQAMEYEAAFQDRDRSDPEVPDQMIAWLLERDRSLKSEIDSMIVRYRNMASEPPPERTTVGGADQFGV